ncbi:MAG: HAD family hydrolase [bacterium]
MRELADDRILEDSEAGDVFVTTWQTVATRVLDRRNVRKVTENTDSVDMLVQKLRERGFRIGVVVDEAHHSFHGQTQAGTFFRDVLAPDYALLITATPDDKMLETFEEKMGIVPEQRIRIGREDAVEAGLIKVGVRCAAYVIEPEKARLVDLEGLALRDAVGAHRGIKAALAEAGADFTPLLLVQVDSRDDEADERTEKSVQRVKEKLLNLGFTEEQIAVHTAKEPDDGLLALAHDMTREVLVFKMAVALGFDAPRAFAQWLDGDNLGVVRWWLRNSPQQPWSVNVPRPDGRGFFPDFVVGIMRAITVNDGLIVAVNDVRGTLSP